MSASEAVTRTKQGIEGLVQKTAEAVTPAGTDEDLNPWKKTPLSDDSEKSSGGEELTKEDFERAAQKAQEKVESVRESIFGGMASGGVPDPEINTVRFDDKQGKEDKDSNADKGPLQKIYNAAANAINPTAHAAPEPRDSHLDKAREYANKSGHEAQDSASYLGKAGQETAQAAKDAASRTASRAEDRAEDAKQATSGYLGKVKDSLTGMWHQAGEKGQEVADSARDTANQAGNKLAEGRDAVYDQSSKAAEQAKQSVDTRGPHWKETANYHKDAADRNRQEMADRLTDEKERAKQTLTEEKEKVKETGSSALESVRQGINNLFGRAQERTQAAGDKLQDKADDARRNMPDSKDVRAEGESVVESVKEGAQHAKDATVDAAKYIAGRFTAPVSGDEKTDQEQVDKLKQKGTEAKDNAAGKTQSFFDTHVKGKGDYNRGRDLGAEAKQHGDEAKDHAKSALEQATDAVRARTEEVKEKVHHAVEQAEEDFIPKTYEEELQSSGYIPSNTADIIAQKEAEEHHSTESAQDDPALNNAFSKSALGFGNADIGGDLRDARNRS